jgi:hypothetical protein
MVGMLSFSLSLTLLSLVTFHEEVPLEMIIDVFDQLAQSARSVFPSVFFPNLSTLTTTHA